MNKRTNNAKQESSIPDSVLTRLFDCSGSIEDGTKGFILFYVNSEGSPSIYAKSTNACVEMALHKLIELYATQKPQHN